MKMSNMDSEELLDRVSVSSSLDLDTNTPGGAFVRNWEESGYSTDANTLMSAVVGAMGKGSKTSQKAAQTALTSGQITAGACAVTGVGTAVAPLCGLIGGGLGAIAVYTGSLFGRVNEAEADLRYAWSQADVALAEVLCAIATASKQTLGTDVSMEDAGWILRSALIGLGHSATADKMWGAHTIAPKNVCSSIWRQNYPCKEQIDGGLSGGRFSWHIIESWWMLKSRYGSCVDQGDLKSDLCGKASTCDDRTKRMGKIIAILLEGLGAVLAALINMADEKLLEYELATASGREAVAQAAVEMQRAYGEHMRQQALKRDRVEQLLNAGFANEDAEWISESLDVTVKALVLVDRYSYSPDRAASILGSARDQGSDATRRVYNRAVWWAKNWKLLAFGGVVAAGGAGAAYIYWRR